MTATALITGASSGIGAAIARYHAAKGGDLVLIAGRQEALDQLKTDLEGAHGIKVHVFARDIGSAEAALSLYDDVTPPGLEPGVVINNARFGGRGDQFERRGMWKRNLPRLRTLRAPS